jgi:hypothetical protein
MRRSTTCSPRGPASATTRVRAISRRAPKPSPRSGTVSCRNARANCARFPASGRTPQVRSHRSRLVNARRSSTATSRACSLASPASSTTSSRPPVNERCGNAPVRSLRRCPKPRHPAISIKGSWSSARPCARRPRRAACSARSRPPASRTAPAGKPSSPSSHAERKCTSCASSRAMRCGCATATRSCSGDVHPMACSADCGSCRRATLRWMSRARSALQPSTRPSHITIKR